MNYLALFLDSVFLFIASFVACLCLFYFFIPYPYSIVVAFCVTSIITLFGVKFLGIGMHKKAVNRKERKLYFDTIIRLHLMKESKVINLFERAICKDLDNIERRKNGFYCPDKNTLYVIKFGFAKVTKADVVKFFNLLRKKDKVVFYCENYDQEIINFASRFNKRVVLLDGKDAFELLKKGGILPDGDYTEFYTEKAKPQLKMALLKKKNAKKFFFFGVFFCLMSFFVPIKNYYLFCGCVMMIFAVVIKIFGKAEVSDGK